jgi:4-amino-4-deoxy-L-arabinose transferase-like glycosyltransferase
MSLSRNEKIICLILFIGCLFVFSLGLRLHGVEYRDDEIFYFQASREMLQEGNFFSPTYFGEHRFQKPILFYWFILISYQCFGAEWFAARMVAVVFAGLSVCFTYRIARLFSTPKAALAGAFILASGPLFLRHAKTVVPDMALNFFIVASVYYALDFIYYGEHRRSRSLFYVMSALGFLVKGFAALVIPWGVVLAFVFFTGRKERLREFRFIRGFLLWLVIVAPWFIYMSVLHGGGYLHYMLVEETADRIIGKDQSNLLLILARRFGAHLGFYLRNILSYFLPWSLTAVLVLPQLIKHNSEEGREREGILLCSAWIVLVLFIFSNMYFTISHYMLVLSTPLSLAAAIGLERLQRRKRQGQIFWINVFYVLLLGVGVFAFAFLSVFLAGYSRIWLVFFAAAYISLILIMMERKNVIVSSGILAAFIIAVFSQSALMIKAGVASHGTLQKFAQTVQADAGESTIVGVGSHDIHEKEWQVYFDKPLIKAGHSHAGVTRNNLRELLSHDAEVYCLLTQNDYNEYRDLIDTYRPVVVQKEHMVRKRMSLDRNFAKALLTFDADGVRGYLTELILLIKKEKNDGI